MKKKTRWKMGYGYFPGGNPNNFFPDEEMCTKEEIANWKTDCKAWNEGRRKPCPPPCQHVTDSEGKIVLTLTAPRYGMGTYRYKEDVE